MKLILLLLLFCCSVGYSVNLRSDLRKKLKSASSLQDLMGKVNLMQLTPTGDKERMRFPQPKLGKKLSAAAAMPQGRVSVYSAGEGSQGPFSSPAQGGLVDNFNFMNRIRQGNDRCHLKPVCVPVPSPPLHPPELQLYPKCHEVMRCVGSCCDEYNKCHPERKRDVQRQVVHLQYFGKDISKTRRIENITVEEHLSCSCNDCGREAPSCDRGYILGDWCECVCENVDILGECIIEDDDNEVEYKLDVSELVKQGKDTCSLEVVCVPVPTNNTQHNVVVFPNCFEVHRCLGSCCDHHDNCHTIASRIIHKPAAELIYLGDDNFVLNKTVMIPIEEHIACSCMNCDEYPPHCKDGLKLNEHCQCS